VTARTLFVTASGTGVGKTYVAAALARALTAQGKPVAVLKPVISGFAWAGAAASDTALLLQGAGVKPTHAAIEAASPWRFEAPLAPDMAAARENRALDFKALVDFCRDAEKDAKGLLLIEGVGGVMAPLDDSHTVLDWMAEIETPVLVVVGSYLGAISHALTAVEALRSRYIGIAAVVVDESDGSTVPLDDTCSTMKRFLPGHRLAAVKRDARPADVLAAMTGVVGI
jgi:dethiobiotin synthetase